MERIPAHLPDRIRNAVKNYAKGARGGPPVSVPQLVKVARYGLPDLAMSDDELERLISDVLLECGCTIDATRRSRLREVGLARVH